MKKFMPVILAIILTLSAFSVQVRQAYAVGAPPPPTRGLSAVLSGPAIEGVVPEAKANFQSTLGETSLAVGASQLNLPDFTCLDVAFGRTVITGISVRGGSAFVSLRPSPEVVHSGELITISIGEPPVGQTGCGIILPGGGLLAAPATGTVILSGTFQ